jgi:4-hydroxy-2-oxoheptanedioate aldolase
VQIEHIEAVRQADEILAIDVVDGTFLGPTDLALSMGLGHRDFAKNSAHRAAIQRTLEAGHAAGKVVACNTYSQADARARLAEGFRYITLRSDADLFFQAGTSALDELRNVVDSQK